MLYVIAGLLFILVIIVLSLVLSKDVDRIKRGLAEERAKGISWKREVLKFLLWLVILSVIIFLILWLVVGL